MHVLWLRKYIIIINFNWRFFDCIFHTCDNSVFEKKQGNDTKKNCSIDIGYNWFTYNAIFSYIPIQPSKNMYLESNLMHLILQPLFIHLKLLSSITIFSCCKNLYLWIWEQRCKLRSLSAVECEKDNILPIEIISGMFWLIQLSILINFSWLIAFSCT